MKIVHSVDITPGRCGLYETTRELVYFEREIGLDAYIYDSRPDKNAALESGNPNGYKEYRWDEERSVPIIPLSEAVECDLLVSHSGLTADLIRARMPFVQVAHGRPYSSFLLEKDENKQIYSSYKILHKTEGYKGAITLWEPYVAYLEMLFPKVHYAPACVDLDLWGIDNRDKFDFGGLGGDVNVVISDLWRKDKDPYHVINGFYLFYKEYMTKAKHSVKLHLYGLEESILNSIQCLLSIGRELGCLGEIAPMVPSLPLIYRSADILLTPHNIATRTVREAMACGVTVVGGPSNPFTKYSADPEDLRWYSKIINDVVKSRLSNKEAEVKIARDSAMRNFDPIRTAKRLEEIYLEVM